MKSPNCCVEFVLQLVHTLYAVSLFSIGMNISECEKDWPEHVFLLFVDSLVGFFHVFDDNTNILFSV